MSRILVIEDESAIRRVLIKILSEENEAYQVFEAEDGLKGMEIIKKEDFDLVLCDIKMPKMDGVEVLEAARQVKPEIPFYYDIRTRRFRHRCEHHAFRRFRLYFQTARPE